MVHLWAGVVVEGVFVVHQDPPHVLCLVPTNDQRLDRSRICFPHLECGGVVCVCVYVCMCMYYHIT